MKTPSRRLIQGSFVGLLLAAILGAGWWLAAPDRGPVMRRDVAKVDARGPMEPSFCGPPLQPLPPPPVNSPFGLHLYASTPLGKVRPLAAMEIVNRLAVPDGKGGAPVKIVAAAGGDETPKNETTYDDVEAVSLMLQEYRRAFGAMPVGELNDEIVRRLQGENPRGIAVLPKVHPAINAEGELMDRWGTPYRFHPESAWHTTVRSAGPDRKMWTADDVISEDMGGEMAKL